MAPLPVNNTTRYMFDYVTGSQTTSKEHTVTVRVTPGFMGNVTPVPPDTRIQAQFLEVLQTLTAPFFRANWRVIRVRKAIEGSDFSFPIEAYPDLTSFVGSTASTYLARYEAVQQIFVGRSASTGRKAYFGLYAAMTDVDSQFRIEGGASSTALLVRNTVAKLNSYQDGGSFISVSNTNDTVWYQYMNQNYNSHWETQLRY